VSNVEPQRDVISVQRHGCYISVVSIVKTRNWNTDHYLTYKAEILSVCVCVYVCMYACVRGCARVYMHAMYVCSLIAREGINDFHQTWHAFSLRPGREHRKVKTSEKCPEFDSREGGSCSSESKQIEEQRQDHSCVFRRADYRNKDHNAKKLSWVRVPMKMLGLGVILFCLYDIQPYVSNDQAYGKFSINKD
jgi:hypothetical protein